MIVNRLLNLMKTKLSRRSAVVDEEQLRIPVGVRVKPTTETQKENSVDDEIRFDADVPGRVAGDGSRKNVLKPNKIVEPHTVTEPLLKILTDSSRNANRSAGFDPYDNGSFETSKTWGSGPHK